MVYKHHKLRIYHTIYRGFLKWWYPYSWSPPYLQALFDVLCKLWVLMCTIYLPDIVSSIYMYVYICIYMTKKTYIYIYIHRYTMIYTIYTDHVSKTIPFFSFGVALTNNLGPGPRAAPRLAWRRWFFKRGCWTSVTTRFMWDLKNIYIYIYT